MKIHVGPVDSNQIDEALKVLLDREESPAGAVSIEEKVWQFKQLAVRCEAELGQQIVVTGDGEILFSCLFSVQAGRTGFVYVGPCRRLGRVGANVTAADEAVRELCRWASREGCTMLQVLLEPESREEIELCERSGFKKLTEMAYLILPIELGRDELPSDGQVVWGSYSAKTHEEFRRVILETYRESLDCPELEGHREIEDVIAGHKAVGEFDADGWRLLRYQGEPAGVVLLARQRASQLVELVYMGIVPKYRGCGLGGLLLTEAVRWTRQAGERSIMLAVDSRNKPAYDLYSRFGFYPVFRRTVMLQFLITH